MTRTEHDVELRVRRTFEAIAEATSVEVAPPLELGSWPDRSRRRPALAVAATLLLLVVVGALVGVDRGADSGITSTSPIRVEPLPPGLDLEHGVPVFANAAPTAEAVADAYVRDRFGAASDEVTLEPPVTKPGGASVRWSTRAASGTLLLARSTRPGAAVDQWSVRVATTDTVDASRIVHRHGEVSGRATTTAPLPLEVRVTGPRDEPVFAATGRGGVDVHGSMPHAMARVQLRLLDDGHPVSITEFRLDLSMPSERHRLATGSWSGGTWELLGSGTDGSEMECWSVVLSGVDSGTGCGGGGKPLPDGFVALSSAATSESEVLVVGQLGPDVAELAFRAEGHEDVTVRTIGGIVPAHERYTLVALPAGVTVEVEGYDDDGRSLGTHRFAAAEADARPFTLRRGAPAPG
jgi:hypothetical protein